MNINAETPFSICLPLVNECVSEAARQRVSSCSPLRGHKGCQGTHTGVRTVLRKLQHVVQKWRVPIEGAEPGEKDRAGVGVVETRR